MSCEIVVNNIETKITGMYPWAAIDQELSYNVPGARFMPSVRAGRWDGRVRLLRQDRFPSGLVNRVTAVLRREGTKFRVIDMRENLVVPPVPHDQKYGSARLRDYQHEAVKQMLERLRGVVVVPTAGGKTLIAAAVIKALDRPTAYIVHTKTLLTQTVKAFHEVGLDVGAVGAGVHRFGKVTVFTVQTLMSMVSRHDVERLADFQVYICDEAHHLSSNGQKASWYITARCFRNATARFGLTATPITQRYGMLLEAATGPIIHKVEVRELQKQGFIAESRPVFIEIDKPNLYFENYTQAYHWGVMHNYRRNQLAVSIALQYARQGKLVMLFVDRIEHGEILNEWLTDSAYEDHRFLSGNDGREEIEDVKEAAKRKEINILIVTRKLFGEGVDIPVVDVLINAAGGKSPIVFTQMFGRGLRIAEGKEDLLYVDFFDKTSTYLEDHAKARFGYCQRKLKQPVIVQKTEEIVDVARNAESSQETAGVRRRSRTQLTRNGRGGNGSADTHPTC